MKIRTTNDTSTREITFEVTGAPDIDVAESWQEGPRWMRPDQATLRMVNGEVRRLAVSGYMVKKDGALSESRRGTANYRADGSAYRDKERLDNAPEQFRQLAAEAPQGVTAWSWPDA